MEFDDGVLVLSHTSSMQLDSRFASLAAYKLDRSVLRLVVAVIGLQDCIDSTVVQTSTPQIGQKPASSL